MKNLESLGLKVINSSLSILDQQLLPHQEKWLDVETPQQLVDIIKALKVRGAPLIAVAAAVMMGLMAEKGAEASELLEYEKLLRSSRPTAVNLMNILDRFLEILQHSPVDTNRLIALSERVFQEDAELCEKIAENGASLIEDGDGILTHCNTGGIATAGVGTAIGIIRRAHELGKNIHVWVDETRPLLQGGRLTTWELEKLKIPYTLITDNMAPYLMSQGKIQKVFVGADRVAMNGDFANKIGTYGVAVSAHFHKIPFYPVAPYTTVDTQCLTGKEIPIEERDPREVQGIFGAAGELRWSPKGCPVYNPAFDVTPIQLVTALVHDQGVSSQTEIINGELNTMFNAPEAGS